MDVLGLGERYNDRLTLALRQHIANEEAAEQKAIIKARDLYAGVLHDDLRDELETALITEDDDDAPHLINIVQTAVAEWADRLTVKGFYNAPQSQTDDEAAGDEVEWARLWWERFEMDALQAEIYEAALVDGEAYLLLDPTIDARTNEFVVRPRLHRRYTAPENGGTSDGVRVYRTDGIVTLAEKRWHEWRDDSRGRERRVERLTLYVAGTDDEPAQIQKFVRYGSAWERFEEDGASWPIIWTDSRGDSLPLPIIPFTNIGGKRRPDELHGSQIVLNDHVVAMIKATAMQGSPMLYLFGAWPTTDGQPPNASNVWKVGPSQIVGNSAPANETQFGRIQPGDLSQIMAAIDKIILMTAAATGTRGLVANTMSGSNLSGEALAEMDKRSIAATRKLQTTFGNSYQRMFRAVSEMYRVFGRNDTLALPVHAQWEPAQVTQHQDPLARSQVFSTLVAAGVEIESAALIAGYSEDEAATMADGAVPLPIAP